MIVFHKIFYEVVKSHTTLKIIFFKFMAAKKKVAKKATKKVAKKKGKK